MKRKIISWVIVISMLILLCFTASAAEVSTDSLESQVSDRIEQMISMFYSDSPGQYEIGNAITIYNADTVCVYYIIPIFCNEDCVGSVELDETGNVSLSDDVTLYTHFTELESTAYLLYTSGGIVYAELPGEIVELYDSGFVIPQNSAFTMLPYTEKVAAAEMYMESTSTGLDVSDVIANTEPACIVVPKVSTYSVVPTEEIEECSITNFVRQGNYNLCWAACVATIANYKNGSALTAIDIATELNHNYTSTYYPGASATETAYALSLYDLSYSPTSAKLSWAGVKSNIANDHPFIVGITTSFYDPDLGQIVTYGHMLTGYGYYCLYGDSIDDANSRCVSVWDPNGTKLSFQYHASGYSLYGYTWQWIETLID